MQLPVPGLCTALKGSPYALLHNLPEWRIVFIASSQHLLCSLRISLFHFVFVVSLSSKFSIM